jgi:hypothetical protein
VIVTVTGAVCLEQPPCGHEPPFVRMHAAIGNDRSLDTQFGNLNIGAEAFASIRSDHLFHVIWPARLGNQRFRTPRAVSCDLLQDVLGNICCSWNAAFDNFVSRVPILLFANWRSEAGTGDLGRALPHFTSIGTQALELEQRLVIDA